jgi:hypothetical protein
MRPCQVSRLLQHTYTHRKACSLTPVARSFLRHTVFACRQDTEVSSIAHKQTHAHKRAQTHAQTRNHADTHLVSSGSWSEAESSKFSYVSAPALPVTSVVASSTSSMILSATRAPLAWLYTPSERE